MSRKRDSKKPTTGELQYISLIPNLPDGIEGIYSLSPEEERRRLDDIRLGVGKGRAELRQQAQAIVSVDGDINSASVQQPEAAAESSPPRLVANVECLTATLDGEAFDVKSPLAVRWLKVLIDHPGVWIAKRDLKQFDPELDDCRTDRLKKYLPPEILSLIDSETGKGSRLQIGLARP